MNKALKGKTSRLLVCALLCVALVFGVFTSIGSALMHAYADDEEETVKTFTIEELSVTNGQFSQSTGSFPKSPSNWTGGGIDGKGTSGVIGGVMDIDTYAANKDKYELDKYYPNDFPGNTSPKTPFGEANYPGTNKSVLLINVHSGGTAYGYTSSTVTFTANRYYMVTAWVRTGNFDDGMGAAIKLNGLDEDVGFNNINTLRGITPNDKNDYGWEEFKFYIATSSLTDRTVSISLQVGDSYTDTKDDTKSYYLPATGYAMFDNIQAYQISPENYFYAKKTLSASDHTIIRDFSNKTSEQFKDIENLDFASGIGDNDWKVVLGKDTDYGDVNIGTYNGSADFDKDNRYHLTSDPLSTYGKYTDVDNEGDSSILVISSYSDGAFKSVAAGVASQKFTLERYRYYRISAWVKTQEVGDEGSGATLALSVVRNENQDEYKGQNLFATKTSCEGDSEAIARGMYKQYSLYVIGSSLRDYEASVECWLGTEGNMSSGIAIFDNVTIEEITPADYTAYSGNGTVVNLDTDSGVEESYISFADTGITNGEFYNIESYDKFEYPFSPAGWSMFTPSTAATTGYSTEESFLDLDNLTHGVIPTDSDTFDKYVGNFGGAYNYGDGTRNLLLMSSPKLTAFCYRSPDFSLSSDSPAVLTVEMLTESITGYGASLVLKDSNNVISSIEQIQNSGSFKTYSFYIDPSKESPSTLRVEIWLGNSDRKENSSKRASGRIYVQKVSLTTLTDDENGDSAATKFSNAQNAYELAKHVGSTITSATYSYDPTNFGAYDYYDSSYLKRSYNWRLTVNGGDGSNVHYGVFDPGNHPDSDGLVPDNFKNEQDPDNNNVLMLYNAAPAASSLTSSNAWKLSADTYYQVDVWLKVDIPEQDSKNAKGVSVSLSGTDFAFKNIVDTSETTDGTVNKEVFRKYTFYIAPGAEDTSLAVVISLGDDSSASGWCSGRVYISSITFTDINSSLFDERATDIEENGNDQYSLVARLAEQATEDGDNEEDGETPETTETNQGLSWWLIPSILFAIAILAAIIGFTVRKIVEKKQSKKGAVKGKSSYDRAATLNQTHNRKTTEKTEKVTEVIDDTASAESYEAFDDDAEQTKAPAEKTEEPVAEEAPAEVPSTEEAPATEEGAPTEEAPAENPAEEPKTESPAPAVNDFDRFDD